MPPSEIGLYYTRRLKKTSNHGALDLKVCLLSSSSFVYFLIRLIRWAIVCQLIREKNKRDRIDVVKECVRGVLRLNFLCRCVNLLCCVLFGSEKGLRDLFLEPPKKLEKLVGD